MTTSQIKPEAALSLTTKDLLDHWQGHRRLTRRVIVAFPDEQLFEYSIGGMRPFATLIKEIIDVSGPGIRGLATGEWDDSVDFNSHSTEGIASKAELLSLFDEGTATINTYLPMITADQFMETVLAFGMYEGTRFNTMLYFIDNEIHHRGQGTVYLRSLGVEPPAFYDRS